MLGKLQKAITSPPPAPKLIGLIGESYSGKTSLVKKIFTEDIVTLIAEIDYDDITASTVQEYIKKYQALPSGKPIVTLKDLFSKTTTMRTPEARTKTRIFFVDALESYSNAKHILTFLVETNQRAIITTTESILIPSNSKFQKIYMNTKKESLIPPEEIILKDTFYTAPYQAAKVILTPHYSHSKEGMLPYIRVIPFYGTIIREQMSHPPPRDLLLKSCSQVYTEAYETDTFMVSHFLWDEYPIFLSKTSPEKELTKKTSYAADCFSLADLTAPWNTSGATQTREFVEWSESLIAHAPFISSSSSSSSSGYTMKTFFPASISKQGQISRAKTSLAEFPSTSQARNDLEIIKVLGIEYFLVNSNSSPRYTADEINRLLKLCGESLLTNKQIKEYTLKKCFRVTSA